MDWGVNVLLDCVGTAVGIDSEFAGPQILHPCGAAFGCLRCFAAFEPKGSHRDPVTDK